MKIGRYEDFIAHNIAPKGAKRLVLCNSNGVKVGQFGLQNLALPNIGEKQYSFGALSDVHIVYQTAQSDFQKALTFLNEEENVDFICICGDLTQKGVEEQFIKYKEYVDKYSPNTPVYAIAGNHESYSEDWTTNDESVLVNLIQTYTGKPLYYSFTQGNDVFIMLGIINEGKHFTQEELQWLYETLEANRNKRCFVFQHIFPANGTTPTCGNAYGIYSSGCWKPIDYSPYYFKDYHDVFENLMKHYKNVMFFHGHSHLEFALQSKDCKYANYYEGYGYKSVHIPSLAVLRSGNSTGNASMVELYEGSQGYVVDVYENGIHLRGRDFVKGEYLPIASYWIDTTLQTVEAGTFTDSTGIITV